MGEETIGTIIIDGQEIKAISGEEITINYENDTIERDCEITTPYGIIRFKAVFTEEQWINFVEISKASKDSKTESVK